MTDADIDITGLVALAVAAAACITDVRAQRIPNVLTFGAALAAIVWHTMAGGPAGALTATGGWLVGTLLFLPLFALHGMGAGDVKLLAALGAWLGPLPAIWVAIAASIAGGVIAVGMALAYGYLGTALSNIRALLHFWCTEGLKPAPGLTLTTSNGPKLAYAIPIGIGTMVAVWLR